MDENPQIGAVFQHMSKNEAEIILENRIKIVDTLLKIQKLIQTKSQQISVLTPREITIGEVKKNYDFVLVWFSRKNEEKKYNTNVQCRLRKQEKVAKYIVVLKKKHIANIMREQKIGTKQR